MVAMAAMREFMGEDVAQSVGVHGGVVYVNGTAEQTGRGKVFHIIDGNRTGNGEHVCWDACSIAMKLAMEKVITDQKCCAYGGEPRCPDHMSTVDRRTLRHRLGRDLRLG